MDVTHWERFKDFGGEHKYTPTIENNIQTGLTHEIGDSFYAVQILYPGKPNRNHVIGNGEFTDSINLGPIYKDTDYNVWISCNSSSKPLCSATHIWNISGAEFSLTHKKFFQDDGTSGYAKDIGIHYYKGDNLLTDGTDGTVINHN